MKTTDQTTYNLFPGASQDRDRKDPLHDDIVMWVYNNFDTNKLLEKNRKKWEEAAQSIIQKMPTLLGSGYHFSNNIDEFTNESRIDKFLELLVQEKKEKYSRLIGFLDLLICLYSRKLEYECRDSSTKELAFYSSRSLELIAFEIKTAIPSLGELLRQLNLYRAYNKAIAQSYIREIHEDGMYYDWKDVTIDIVVVCPDDKYKTVIEEQGYRFIKYDPNIPLP